MAIVDLQFPDSKSNYLRNLVLGLGRYHDHGPPLTHSTTRGWFWDVKPIEKTELQARSESKFNFPWHTDCSFESRPPRFFALHVLHADRNGGGTLAAMSILQLIRRLKPSTYEALCRPDFLIPVPLEFAKGTASINGSLISPAKDPSQARLRYRSDIIRPLTNDARVALDEVDRLLVNGPESEGAIWISLTSEILPDRTICLMDNGRFMHARTQVLDSERHLRRIRWDRQEFGSSSLGHDAEGAV
ncbi:hypothetical protein MMC10_010886 [Thelotrema lepadinum]|nr:hypothetical protein [Thelotrema lepadinum]